MTLKILSLLSLLFFGLFSANPASALDADRCPNSFNMTVEVVKVFKSSIYSKTPGWKEAQAALAATRDVKIGFDLVEAKPKACTYEDAYGQRATLSTASFRDPEEWDPKLVDQLRINLKIDGSSYVSYLPIKSYDVGSIEAHSRPFALKVKSRLYFQEAKRWLNIDMGMVSVTLN